MTFQVGMTNLTGKKHNIRSFKGEKHSFDWALPQCRAHWRRVLEGGRRKIQVMILLINMPRDSPTSFSPFFCFTQWRLWFLYTQDAFRKQCIRNLNLKIRFLCERVESEFFSVHIALSDFLNDHWRTKQPMIVWFMFKNSPFSSYSMVGLNAVNSRWSTFIHDYLERVRIQEQKTFFDVNYHWWFDLWLFIQMSAHFLEVWSEWFICDIIMKRAWCKGHHFFATGTQRAFHRAERIYLKWNRKSRPWWNHLLAAYARGRVLYWICADLSLFGFLIFGWLIFADLDLPFGSKSWSGGKNFHFRSLKNTQYGPWWLIC